MTIYKKTFADALKEVRKPKVVKEDYEVSMAIGQLKTIQDRVGKIMDFLSGKVMTIIWRHGYNLR